MNYCPAILLMVVLAAAGCQGNPQVRRVVDSYNAENRQLEDYIYLLEQDIQVLEQENAHLRRRIEGGSGSGGSGSTPRRGGLLPRGRGAEEASPPGLDIETPEIPSPSRPEAPRPLNKPAVPEELDIGPTLEGPSKSPSRKPPNDARPALAELPVPPEAKPEPEVVDKKVTHIHLNPLHTCGADFDHAPGDDGLSILIEPRNAANQFVPLAAPVSVVVLDPNKNGEEARIARWDFTAADVAEKTTKGETRGIHLMLPWPGKPPAGARLEVFVRYETQGQKLQADKEIILAVPGQFSNRWTPRPADRKRMRPIETTVAKSKEPRGAAIPPPPAAPLESPAEKAPAAKAPPLVTPPTGLSERQPGEKPARPKWGPTR